MFDVPWPKVDVFCFFLVLALHFAQQSVDVSVDDGLIAGSPVVLVTVGSLYMPCYPSVSNLFVPGSPGLPVSSKKKRKFE